MATIPISVPVVNPKVFYAHLYSMPGILTKYEGTLYFMEEDSGRLIEFEPEMANFCAVLGEVGIANTQHIMDLIHKGHAAITCNRVMGVA